MTHDYKRNGTTTLFAALNVLDGSVIGQNMQRHRHQEFIRFLNRSARLSIRSEPLNRGVNGVCVSSMRASDAAVGVCLVA